MSLPDVAIVTARCGQTRSGFGMRLERADWNTWVVDWAFPLSEQVAARERYEERRIEGAIVNHQDFPGCPHCQAGNFMMCGNCGKVTCWNMRSRVTTCAWCCMTGELSGSVTSIQTSGDR